MTTFFYSQSATIIGFFDKHIHRIVDSVEGLESTNEFFIRLAISAAIIIAVLLLKKHISKILLTIVAKTIARRSDKESHEIVKSLTPPLNLLLIIASIVISFKIIVPSGELRTLTEYIIKIGIIISVCWAGVRYLNDELFFFSSPNDENSRSRKTAFKFITNVGKIIIIFVGALLILELFGFSASRIFAALGIGGVAIAFACKDAVENLISGFIIVFNKPFHVKDFITFDEKSGTVEDITVRTTTLRMLDGSPMVVPNTVLANSNIVNWSRMEKRLITQTFCLSYNHTSDEAEKFMTDLRSLLEQNEHVLSDDIRVNFSTYDRNGMNIDMFFYVKDTSLRDYSDAKSEIMMDIKKLIGEDNITLAYNTTTVLTQEGK